MSAFKLKNIVTSSQHHSHTLCFPMLLENHQYRFITLFCVTYCKQLMAHFQTACEPCYLNMDFHSSKQWLQTAIHIGIYARKIFQSTQFIYQGKYGSIEFLFFLLHACMGLVARNLSSEFVTLQKANNKDTIRLHRCTV